MNALSLWFAALLLLGVATGTEAQVTITELRSPYSFLSSPAGTEYFISNVNGEPEAADNNGFITKLGVNGKVTDLKFIQGGKGQITLHAPKGMALVEQTLFVADLDTVRGFDSRSGASTLALVIPHTSGPVSLSDVASDGKGLLYCSDQQANRIYRIDLATKQVSVLITDPALAGPAGLAVHPKSGQLIAVSWDKGKILEIAPDGTLTELFSNGFFSSRFHNLRGVDFDSWGNMYVSDSTAGKVWRMSWDKRFQVIAEYLPWPGDLGIDRTNNLILVPYEQAQAAEMNGLETPTIAKSKKEKRTLADYGFIPPPPKPAAEGAPVK